MDPTVQQLLTGGGTGATILVLCYLLVKALLAGFSTELQASRTDFAQALTDQRKDFTDSLSAVRTACTKAAPLILLLLMTIIGGCTPGQDVEAGAIKLSGLGLSAAFAGFTVSTPAGTTPVQSVATTAAKPPTTSPSVK